MKLAIMQPYFFPYIGYFRLVAAVDRFVFYDDVNFIKNGWINRNRLFLAGDVRYITISLSGASPFLKIDEINIQMNDLARKKILESIRHSYSKAAHFREVNDILSEVLFSTDRHISTLAKLSVILVSKYLDLQTEFVMSSSCYKNSHLAGAGRVIEICRNEGADAYYNLPNGEGLYERSMFESNGIDLCFIQPNLIPYLNFSGKFYPGLSIIDVLMFNDKNAVREMLC